MRDRSMRFIAALVLAAALPALGQEPDPPPLARARIEPGEALVSAPTTLTVEVMTASFFRGAVRFPDTLPVEDAVVIMSTRGRGNFNQREGGRSWAAWAAARSRRGSLRARA